jgi:hypothetical protein
LQHRHGVFITDDGYLISNFHVVKDAAKVRLLTGTGLIDASVLKVDAANDLALLKAVGAFKPLPIAASRTVKLGGTVATVGQKAKAEGRMKNRSSNRFAPAASSAFILLPSAVLNKLCQLIIFLCMAASLRLNEGRNVFCPAHFVRDPAAARHQRAGVCAGASRARRPV